MKKFKISFFLSSGILVLVIGVWILVYNLNPQSTTKNVTFDNDRKIKKLEERVENLSQEIENLRLQGSQEKEPEKGNGEFNDKLMKQQSQLETLDAKVVEISQAMRDLGPLSGFNTEEEKLAQADFYFEHEKFATAGQAYWNLLTLYPNSQNAERVLYRARDSFLKCKDSRVLQAQEKILETCSGEKLVLELLKLAQCHSTLGDNQEAASQAWKASESTLDRNSRFSALMAWAGYEGMKGKEARLSALEKVEQVALAEGWTEQATLLRSTIEGLRGGSKKEE